MRARVALTLLAALGAARPTLASPAEAALAKDTAYKAYEVSDYDAAIAGYKEAYRLTSDPRLFYNLGLSHRKRFQLKGSHADLVEARDYFHRFLELLDPQDPKHAKERSRLEQMRSLAQTYLVELESELAKSVAVQPIEVHAVQVRSAPPKSPVGKLLLVSAGLLGIGGGVTGVLALRANGDANRARTIGDIDNANSLGGTAHHYALGTDVMCGAAIVAGTLGLYLVLRRPAAPGGDARVSVSASPFGAALVVRY